MSHLHTRVMRLHAQLQSKIGRIDLAAVAQFREDAKAYWTAMRAKATDWKTGASTAVPAFPIKPPGYEEWSMSVNGPPPALDFDQVRGEVEGASKHRRQSAAADRKGTQV